MAFNENYIDELSKEPSFILNLLMGASDELFVNIIEYFIFKAYRNNIDNKDKIANLSWEISISDRGTISFDHEIYTKEVISHNPEFVNKIDIFFYNSNINSIFNQVQNFIVIGEIDSEKKIDEENLIININSELIQEIKSNIKHILDTEHDILNSEITNE
jgi:hypothetical protein